MNSATDTLSQPQPPLLDVFLLTYNRERQFRRTLEAIAASPLRGIPLTIMDNCSTDGTPQACADFAAQLPLMRVQRHPRNIGFGANLLRAIELSIAQYTWVLCDDDTLFPERIQPLLDHLRDVRPEAVFVGGPRQDEWPTGPGVSPRAIQRDFRTFLTAQSFVPGIVFKTSLITSTELIEGYFGISTNFPQLVIGRKLLIQDIPCSVLSPPAIRRDDPEEKGVGYLRIVDGWSEFCRTLPPEMRGTAFYSIFVRPDPIGMIREIMRMIVWARIDGGGEPHYHLPRIGINAGLQARIFLIPCRIAACLPPAFYNATRETYRRIKYGWLRRPLPSNFHAPITRDELRR